MPLSYPDSPVFYRKLRRTYPLIVRGEGCWLFGSDGQTYLDGCGGAFVANIGHGVAAIGDAMARQATRIAYVSGMTFTHEAVESLAAAIVERAPGDLDHAYFLSSGSEAVEAALKLARQYWVESGRPDKHKVLAFTPSYHGNTLLALSASAREQYRTTYQDWLVAVPRVPAPYVYRCECRGYGPPCPACTGDALEAAILHEGADSVAAFIAEPIGGSSTGASVPRPAFWRRIREICDRHGVLFVADEVLSGAGRTGTWSALEPYGVAPDILVMGKGITGGYAPLSVVVAPRRIVDVLAQGSGALLHAQTYSHHPVACAAGLATIEWIADHDLIARCAGIAPAFHSALEALRDLPHVGDVRGRGLLAGIEFVEDKESRAPFARSVRFAERFTDAAREAGLIVWPNSGQVDGTNGDLVMLAPPFVITESEIAMMAGCGRPSRRRSPPSSPHAETRENMPGPGMRSDATAVASAPPKITYTSANVDMDAFHQQFDDALARVRAAAGQSYPFYIDGEAVTTHAPPLVDRSPIDTRHVLGEFAAASAPDVASAVSSARRAQRAWGRRPWEERVATLRRAAALIRERKFDLAARMSIEVGKSRLESMGDAEEAADLIDYYCQQIADAHGFVRQMARLTPIERNTDVLRPYGVFACIAPFNFPLALSTGMSAAALAAGNTVVYKPAEDAPWTGLGLYEAYRDAGLPAGAFNMVTGHREAIGDALWQHPGIDGVVFTGSKAVGLRIHAGLAAGRWIKPCLLELGGKNATVVTDTADVDAAAEGVARSAFGLQNQKCSATSRVYVDRRVAAPFLDALLARTAAIRIGDPSEREIAFGPVINERAVIRYQHASEQARQEGTMVTGGSRLAEGRLAHGYFVAPAVTRLPLASSIFRDELFVPILAVGEVSSLDEALSHVNDTDYGLTAGIFTGRPDEITRFFDEAEAGVCYANKRTGATTGAWPGAQAFCGWKGSGSTGKGGCGPYYVAQFLREQSRTIIEP